MYLIYCFCNVYFLLAKNIIVTPAAITTKGKACSVRLFDHLNIMSAYPINPIPVSIYPKALSCLSHKEIVPATKKNVAGVFT